MLEEGGQKSQVDFFRLRPSRLTTEIIGDKIQDFFVLTLTKFDLLHTASCSMRMLPVIQIKLN